MTRIFADAGLVLALTMSAIVQTPSPRPSVTPAPAPSAQPAAGVAAAVKPEPIPRTQIAGVVLRPDGRPAPKAEVGFIALPNLGQPAIEPFVVTTDEFGAFRIETRGIREFNVRAYLAPFAAAILSKASGGQRLTLKMEAGTTVQGEVIEAAVSQPLVGADVELADWETSPYTEAPDFSITRTKTDARGRFLVRGASQTGRSLVRVRSRGFATETQTATTPALKFRLTPGHDLAGGVVDASGHPIAKARLSFRPQLVSGPTVRAVTGQTGRFDAVGLRNVPYRVMVTALGFAPVLRDNVSAEQASMVITLDKSARLRGRLVDEGGQSLTGVVRLQSHEGTSVSNLPANMVSAQVAKDGVFELGSLGTGANVVQFAGVGYPSVQKTVDVTHPGETVDLGDVVFDGGLSIRGRIVEKGDVPVVGARISALARRGNTSESVFAESDGEGRFTLRGLADRLYPVVAAAPEFSSLEMSLSPSSDEQALVMTRTLKVRGRVLDSDGLGVNRAQVSAQRGDDRWNSRGASTASDGRFTLELADLGALTVTVNAEGFVALTKTVRVDTEADMGDLILSRGIHLRGFVSDSKGTGISGARVENQTLRLVRTGFVETDEKGAFDLPGGSPGQARIAAGHRDYSPAQVTVDIPETAVGASEPIQITLTKGGRIEGFVRYRDGSPVPQVPVQIRSVGSNTPRINDGGSGPGSDTAFTNSTGGFTFEKLAPGPARLMLMAGQNGQYAAVTATDVAIEEGVTSSATLTLRSTVVRGVVHRNGGAAAGLKVSVFAPQTTSLLGSEPARGLSEEPPWTTALTNSEGRFELRVVSPLKGRAVIDGPERGLSLFSRTVDIPDVDEFPLDIEFGGAKLRGRVLDEETGKGLRDAYVTGGAIVKAGESNPGIPSSALTDASGGFSLDAMPGEYQLSVSADGYLSTRARAVVSPPESEVADISLTKGNTLTARVLLPSGAPAVEAQVRVSDSAVSVNAFTGPDGRFTLRGLPKDGFTLTITHGSDIALTSVPSIPPEPMDIRLSPGARIKVTLVGAVEIGPGAAVFVRQLNNAAYFGAPLGFVDARGQATLVTPPGEILLATSTANFFGEALVQARGGDTVSVEIELKPRTVKPSSKELH